MSDALVLSLGGQRYVTSAGDLARAWWRRHFDAWLRHVSPPPAWRWDWSHVRYICEALERVTRGETRRVMIACPPRHGKSALVTVRYATHRIVRDPTTNVIVAAYGAELASTFSREARRLAQHSDVELDETRQTAADWRTVQGGGMRAIGVGGGITGHGADLIVIDDPMRSREDAQSERQRDRVWDWYRNDLYTRLEPDGAIILIMTRWHTDDLAGRLLAQDADAWEVVNLPALAEDDDPLGRAPGEALCPERFDEAALEGIRDEIGTWSFAALYQQHPLPDEGAMARREWFRVGRPPDNPNVRRVRAWDLAATAQSVTASDPDYAAGTLMARYGGTWYIEDVVRERRGPGEIQELIASVARQDGHGVPIVIEREPGSAGKILLASLGKRLAGWRVYGPVVSGQKLTRALPFLAQAELGNVVLADANWRHAWLDEVCSFPVGGHDDQVDSASLAFAQLAQSPTRQLQVTGRIRSDV